METEFASLIGSLTLQGPFAAQRRTCTAGQLCTFVLDGQELHADDGVLIMDTCGTVAAPGFPATGTDQWPTDSGGTEVPFRLGHTSAPASSSESGCVFHWEMAAVGAEIHGSGRTGKTQAECCEACHRAVYQDCEAWVYRPSAASDTTVRGKICAGSE